MECTSALFSMENEVASARSSGRTKSITKESGSRVKNVDMGNGGPKMETVMKGNG